MCFDPTKMTESESMFLQARLKEMSYGTLDELYLDYFNNFLTIQGFADYHDIGLETADALINRARTEYNAKYPGKSDNDFLADHIIVATIPKD